MDPITLFLIVALAGFVVFQVFQGRKRKRETEERVSRFVPGVEIMTNYGLYGTIVEVDDERNLVTLEVSPGVEVKIHKQTMLKVADYNDSVAADDSDEASDVDVDDTELDADADISTGKESASAVPTKSAPTTPAFSAADPDVVTEPAPAYGERVVPSASASATPSSSSVVEADAAVVEPVAPKTTSTRAPRKPATPRTTPARTTTPRTPRASASKSATPPADDASSDSQTN